MTTHQFKKTTLIETKPTVLKPDDEGIPHFYNGQDGRTLFIVEKDSALVRFEITFSGKYIEGDAAGNVSYGSVDELDNSGIDSKPKMKSSALIQFEKTNAAEVVKLLQAYFESCQGLKQAHEKLFQDLIEFYTLKMHLKSRL